MKNERAEGRAEGRAESLLATAQRLKEMGMDTDFICKATGLSPEDIEKEHGSEQ